LLHKCWCIFGQCLNVLYVKWSHIQYIYLHIK
jgi:hypothetical protein